LDQSLKHLGRIDLLQLHKATLETVTAPDVARAIRAAQDRGIKTIGASVSDLPTAERAIASGNYAVLQLPYNGFNKIFEPIFAIARKNGVAIVVNRPFAMGRVQAAAGSAKQSAMIAALQHIREQNFDGVILTGTRSQAHLAETLAAFAATTRSARP
jgi:aryl-alcohol dehydrogenase-like predicted oxidoreductase